MGCSAASGTSVVVSDSPKFPQEFLDEYLLGIKLGRGAFATVRACSKIRVCPSPGWNREKPWNEDDAQKSKQSETAVKILDLRADQTPSQSPEAKLQEAQLEAFCWRRVGVHPNCVRLHDLFFGEDFCYMVMEKCQSSLLQSLEDMPVLTERGLGNIAAQMLTGIAHCHSVRIVHRDVKPNNFLVGPGKDGVIKLTDFGLSAMMPKHGKLTGSHGSAPYMSPEMLMKTGHDEKADVWSLGVLVYVLMYGQFPYTPSQKTAKAMKQVIIGGIPSPCYRLRCEVDQWQICRSPTAEVFVRTLLNRDQKERPSAKDALSMPWMAASSQGCHMRFSELPSLLPMVQAAKKCGAFGMCDDLRIKDLARETPADERLNKLQVDRHGRELPQTPTRKAEQEECGSTPEKSFSKVELGKVANEPWQRQASDSSRSTSYNSSRTSLCGADFASTPTSSRAFASSPTASRAGSPEEQLGKLTTTQSSRYKSAKHNTAKPNSNLVDMESTGTANLAGAWTCIATWGLEEFLKSTGVSWAQRRAAMGAPWPLWEFQHRGDHIVFVNKSAVGVLREEITANSQLFTIVDGWKQSVSCLSYWDNGTLIVEKESPQGKFREERRIDENGLLQFSLQSMKPDGPKWGRSFEPKKK